MAHHRAELADELEAELTNLPTVNTSPELGYRGRFERFCRLANSGCPLWLANLATLPPGLGR